MAEKPSRLKVLYSPKATSNLEAIWEWNAIAYGAPRADSYNDFLKQQTDGLGTNRSLAKPVSTQPQYSYISIRKSRRGHGHIAVFVVESEQVVIVRFFHTAQDWETKL